MPNVTIAHATDPRTTELIIQISSERVPIQLAMRLRDLFNELKVIQHEWEIRRQAALLKHAIKDDLGNIMVDERGNATFTPSELEKFTKYVASELEQEVAIKTKLPIDELMGSNLHLSVEQLNLLLPLLTT